METTELRIGNLIQNIETKKEAEVFSLDYLINERIRIDFEPIELTKERLLKYGFEMCGENDYGLELDNGFFIGAYSYGLSNLKYEVILTDEYGNEITINKYVHQLQNLYFTLTGKELIK